MAVKNYQRGGPSGRGNYKAITVKVKTKNGGTKGATFRCGEKDERGVCKLATAAVEKIVNGIRAEAIRADEDMSEAERKTYDSRTGKAKRGPSKGQHKANLKR